MNRDSVEQRWIIRRQRRNTEETLEEESEDFARVKLHGTRTAEREIELEAHSQDLLCNSPVIKKILKTVSVLSQ